MAIVPSPVHGARAVLFALVLLAGLALAAGARADQPAPLDVSKLLPADTAFLYTAEVASFAPTMAKLQAVPKVNTALNAIEHTLGFSLAKDVLPWAGQLAFAFLDVKANNPRMLLLLEIRDQAAFQQGLPLLQTQMEKLSELTWTPETYGGVTLRTTPGFGETALTWGHFGGWLVLGIGDAAVNKSIDAWQGKMPTLADNATWVKAVAGLPAPRSGFFSLNGDAAAAIFADPALHCPMNTAPLRGLTLVEGMTDKEDAVRIDIVATLGSPQQQQQLKALKGALTPVDGAAAAQLPPGTVAALFSSNPAKYVDYCKQWLLAFATDPAAKKEVENDFTHLQPLTKLLDTCPGACALAGCWAKEQGFGLTVVSDAHSPLQANTLVTLITALLKTVAQQPIAVQDGVAALPKSPDTDEMLPWQPCWTAKDAWAKFATAPAWLTANATATVKLPPEALGADSVVMADMSFTAPLLEYLEARMFVAQLPFGERSNWEDGPQQSFMGLTALRMLGLDKMKIIGYSRIADDGTSARGVLKVYNAPGMGGLLNLYPVALLIVVPRLINAGDRARSADYHDNLNQITKGVESFKNDVGVYPAVLDDLYANAVGNLNHDTTRLPGFTANDWHGPYLVAADSISPTILLPKNPYVEGETTVAAHWIYVMIPATVNDPTTYTLTGAAVPPPGY